MRRGSELRSRCSATSTVGWAVSIQSSEDPLGHLVDLAKAVHFHQQATGAVDIEQWLRLLGIDLKADPDGLLIVVGAPVDLRPPE